MGAQVPPAVGHAQTVAWLSSERHLHGDGAGERQRASPRLEARGQARVGGEPAAGSHGPSEETHPVALKEVLRHVHHGPQRLRVRQRRQLGQGRGMLRKVWEGVWLKEQLWRGRGGGGGGGGGWSLDDRHWRQVRGLGVGLQRGGPVRRSGFGLIGLLNVIVVSTVERKGTQKIYMIN